MEENGGFIERNIGEVFVAANIQNQDADLKFCTDQSILSNDPPLTTEMPTSTPLTEELTQNVPHQSPQVSLNPIFNEINETHVLKKE